MKSKRFCFLLLFHASLLAKEGDSLDRTLYSLKHTQANFEQELTKMNNKFQNVELAMESMREEVTTLLKACKETQLSSSQTNRLRTFEKNLDKITIDLKQLKKHSQELSSVHSHLQKKIDELDKTLKLQSEEIRHLETAMRSLTTAKRK